MPVKGRFRLREFVVEVAPRLGLRRDIPRALRRHGPMTVVEIANLLYWGRSPRNFRLGLRWWANRSMRSSTRRAIAKLMSEGVVRAGGRLGRCRLYHFDHAGWVQSNKAKAGRRH